MTVVLLAGSAAADAATTRTLKAHGYSCRAVTSTPSSEDARASDAIVFGDRDGGFDFLRHMLGTPVIIVSRNPDPRAVVRAMRAGAKDYLVPPFEAAELTQALSDALGTKDAETEGDATLRTVFAADSPMAELFEQLKRVAPTDSPVLLQGETGAGKKRLAHAIHDLSERHAQPFLTLNCAAVPPDHQVSELFGDARSAGLTNDASGTLFLDNVAHLSSTAQARLMTVMESPGVTGALPRLVCASRRDLGALAAEGEFRADLYYRLSVVTLKPPPLRERGKDRQLLAQYFLQRCVHRLGKPDCAFTPDAIAAIDSYRWPGNVREMENAIERAVILTQTEQITPELLAIDATPPIEPDTQPEPDPNVSLEDYFVRFVLENQDHCTETELAERLGISRKSLWERRQRLNIPRKRTRRRAPRRTPGDSAD
ncbi:MAG: sigma-54 dependent transcriptional regulator [Pseudomonadota bacterium]